MIKILYRKSKLPLPAGISKGDPFPDYKKDKDGNPELDKKGMIQPLGFTLSFSTTAATTGTPGNPKDPEMFNFHENAASVVSPHKWSFSIIQACIAILILVGFESVTAMGEEVERQEGHSTGCYPIAVYPRRGLVYLIEYFAANYFLNSGYTLSSASSSSASDWRHDGHHGGPSFSAATLPERGICGFRH